MVGNGPQRRAIFQIAELPLRDALDFFERLALKGAKKRNRRSIIK